MVEGVFRNGDGNRMVADFRFNAENRAGHVALHARTSRALFSMVRMGGNSFADCAVALGADARNAGLQLRALLNAGVVGVDVASHAGHTALEKALALPQTESVRRKAASAAVWPICGIFVDGLIVFKDRHKVVVIVVARFEARNKDIAE